MPSVQGHSHINCVALRIIIIILSLSEKKGNDFMIRINPSNCIYTEFSMPKELSCSSGIATNCHSTVSFKAWRITVENHSSYNAMQGHDYYHKECVSFYM